MIHSTGSTLFKNSVKMNELKYSELRNSGSRLESMNIFLPDPKQDVCNSKHKDLTGVLGSYSHGS